MVEFEVKTIKRGSSVGFIIPKNIVNELSIKPNENIIIEIKIDR